MKKLILENLTHRGTVSAAGFLFSAKILSESEMRRRVLRLWQSDAKIFRRGADLILIFPENFRVDCRRAVGLPLVRSGEVLTSFPLRTKDFDDLQTNGESIVTAVGNRVEIFPTNELKIENVEDWFDLSDFQIVETKTLGEVQTKPLIVEKSAPVNLREELKDVPAADNELAEILQILKQKRQEIAGNKKGAIFQSEFSNPIGANVGGFFDALKNLFGAKGESNHQSPPSENAPGKLRKLFTKTLFQMKIAQIVGRKQAQYLAKMMEMFENGDLEQALKHAIPLEDMQALKEATEQMPFLGFLRPRNGLQINYQRQNASSSSVFLEDTWFHDLRQLYRQTFERLVAQNRIEEAAFVLAELLKSSVEAVEFFEKHGKFHLAAQLAESRELAPDIIVRQWFLAGEKKRAIQLAVRHNCFEYVVTKLERENHPQAAVLREIWAENLAASGNFAAAVNTIWQIAEKRDLAAVWIDKTIEFGGVPAAAMLAKKVSLFPGKYDEVKNDLLEILREDAAEAFEKRRAFANESLRLTANDELRNLIRPLARKLLADSAQNFRSLTQTDFRRLVEISGDYALRTDLPKMPETSESKRSEPLILTIAAHDCGATKIYDAHLLPDGKIAVALGEAGVKILSKTGKTVAHFDQPTERFVVADFGTKAICLAKRGGVYRLARIDFVERRAAYWCDAKIENFAATFDGNLWFISETDDIYAIDATAKNFEAVWRVGEIGGQIYEIARSKNKLMLIILNGRGFEKWWYDLPQFILRSRNETKWLQMENERETMVAVSSFVAYSAIAVLDEETKKITAKIFDYDSLIGKIELPEETIKVEEIIVIEKKFALLRTTEQATIVSLYEILQMPIAEFTIDGAKKCSFKLDEKLLIIADDKGRVLVFDCAEKFLRKNARI